VEEKKNTYRSSAEKPEGPRLLGRFTRRFEDNIQKGPTEIE
jgi:hypothetical protein